MIRILERQDRENVGKEIINKIIQEKFFKA
jgi:hypothetical protein